jgi:hypothetical protein
MEAGKKYILKLHLGMRSVDFDAQVTEDWGDINGQADLPSNLPTFKAGTSDNEVTVPAAASTYQFAITGLIGTETVTSPGDATPLTGATATDANAEGVSVASIHIDENTTVKDRNAGNATWSGASSSVTLTFKQKAGALGLSVAGVNKTGKKITLASTATETPFDNDNFGTGGSEKSSRIKVTKNSTPLGYNATPATGQFSFADGVITFYDDITTGDTYKIYVQAGDAEAEEVTITIGAYETAWAASGSYTLAATSAANTYTVTIRGAEVGKAVNVADPTGSRASQLVAPSSIYPKVGANGEILIKIPVNANAGDAVAEGEAKFVVTVNGATFTINVTQPAP